MDKEIQNPQRAFIVGKLFHMQIIIIIVYTYQLYMHIRSLYKAIVKSFE